MSVYILLAVAAVIVLAVVTVKAARIDARDEVDRFRNARRLTTSWAASAQAAAPRQAPAAPAEAAGSNREEHPQAGG